MIERIKDGAVIINGGHVYALFHETEPVNNLVCGACDLKIDCWDEKENKRLSILCNGEYGADDGFFLECLPITNKKIIELCLEQDRIECSDAICCAEYKL